MNSEIHRANQLSGCTISAMNLQTPIVRCANPQCPLPGPIFLPCPPHLKASASPPDWPQDGWQAFVVCHQCGSTSLRGKNDVEWGLSQPSLDTLMWENNSFQRVYLRCDHADCDSNIQLLIFLPGGSRIGDLIKKVHISKDEPLCSNNHALLRPPVVIKTEAAINF